MYKLAGAKLLGMERVKPFHAYYYLSMYNYVNRTSATFYRLPTVNFINLFNINFIYFSHTHFTHAMYFSIQNHILCVLTFLNDLYINDLTVDRVCLSDITD